MPFPIVVDGQDGRTEPVEGEETPLSALRRHDP